MAGSTASVGLLYDGVPTGAQQAAHEWLQSRQLGRTVAFDELTGAERPHSLHEQFDVLWWHRETVPESGKLERVRTRLESFLQSGAALLLTGGTLTAIDELAVESVSPDVVGYEHGEEVGLLWRRLYDDHPVPNEMDALRMPLFGGGDVLLTRYEGILPERGEILASTVWDGQDHPNEMTVCSWRHGKGTVLGFGGPLVFGEHRFSDNRDRVLSALFGSLERYDHPSRPKTAAELTEMRKRLTPDRSRPGYHITPPGNWLNDPNGLFRWNDRYHVFYQYNPGGPFHNTMHWGHATSEDLCTWQDEPVALTPSPDGPDRDGCWSGCAVDDGGVPTILYTGGSGREQLPCLARSTGDLREWEKDAANPIITEVPTDIDILSTEHWEAEFRDHCVWREDDTWYQLIGTGVEDVGGAVLLYTAEKLHNWSYEGPLLIADWEDAGAVWECPELLDLGEKQLLHVSNYEDVVYFLGHLEDGEFVVESRGLLDHGDFYAPQSLTDEDRYLTYGWLPEARDVSRQWDAGWSGALSLPRELSVGNDGRLRQRVAEEITELRGERLTGPKSFALDDERRRLDVSGRQLELELEIELVDAAACELAVFEQPDRAEYTPIRYTHAGELSIDRAPASGDEHASADTQRMPVTPYDEPLSLRVFLDGSIIELYANERHCLTSRVYPTQKESVGLSLAADDGRAHVRSVSAWALGNIFETGKRTEASPVPGADGYRPDSQAK